MDEATVPAQVGLEVKENKDGKRQRGKDVEGGHVVPKFMTAPVTCKMQPDSRKYGQQKYGYQA